MNNTIQYQSQHETAQLYYQSRNAYAENRYADMEPLLEQAIALAEVQEDWPLLIKSRFWLAEAQRMQGKNAEAIATFAWLIALTADTAYTRRLTDNESLHYLASAFIGFVDTGRRVPELTQDQLLSTLDYGMNWLEHASMHTMVVRLRLKRGVLLQQQGNTEEALREIEGAISLRDRLFPWAKRPFTQSMNDIRRPARQLRFSKWCARLLHRRQAEKALSMTDPALFIETSTMYSQISMPADRERVSQEISMS